jgi:hypothetical protein
MICGLTLRVRPEENRLPPIGSRPEGMLFRIMLYAGAGHSIIDRVLVAAS